MRGRVLIGLGLLAVAGCGGQPPLENEASGYTAIQEPPSSGSADQATGTPTALPTIAVTIPPLSPASPASPVPPPPGPIVTEPALQTSEVCGTDQDGVTLYPFEGGSYSDAQGNPVPATGQFVNIVGSTTIIAAVSKGYALPDGTRSHEYVLQFSGMPCTTS